MISSVHLDFLKGNPLKKDGRKWVDEKTLLDYSPTTLKDFNINLFIHFNNFSVNNQGVSIIC